MRIRITDAGSSRSNHSGQENDCSVRAISVAFGLSYDSAFLLAKRYGRKSNKGIYIDSMSALMHDTCQERNLKLYHVRPSRGTKPETISEFMTGRKGTWIVGTYDHYVCVKGGYLHDLYDSSGLNIQFAWEIVKR